MVLSFWGFLSGLFYHVFHFSFLCSHRQSLSFITAAQGRSVSQAGWLCGGRIDGWIGRHGCISFCFAFFSLLALRIVVPSVGTSVWRGRDHNYRWLCFSPILTSFVVFLRACMTALPA